MSNGKGPSLDRIPILRMGRLLLVTIQVDMHDRLAVSLQDDLTERISSTRARGVLIDISALEVVDSFIGRMLGNIAAMARVLDAATVVVGMRPAVAITLVELGLSLNGVRTALDVERGIRMLSIDVTATGRTELEIIVETEVLRANPRLVEFGYEIRTADPDRLRGDVGVARRTDASVRARHCHGDRSIGRRPRDRDMGLFLAGRRRRARRRSDPDGLDQRTRARGERGRSRLGGARHRRPSRRREP